ncbi:MAG: Lrp/AsnC family transcriptional regulator [Promethearchaeota archaeon]
MESKDSEDMEGIDIDILRMLSEDDRVSLRTIAKELNKSPVTIKGHIDKLEEKGIIKDYGVTLNYEKLGFDIIAMIELTISKGKMLEVERDIAKHPNIFAVYDITGEYDAILLARFRNRSELSAMVKEINKYEYVLRTNTHLILNVVKEGTEFPELISQNKE